MNSNQKIEGKDESVFVGEATGEQEDEQLERSQRESPAEEGLSEEDCQPKVVSVDPGRPSQAEIDEHCIDHLPYRSWCACCVQGRGTGEQHRPSGTSTIPVIAFDYLFITKEKVLTREELSDEEEKNVVLKVLVVKDTKSRTIFAHAVRQKGVDEEGYAVARVVEDVKWLGYTKQILKIDGEKAIVKLLKESLKRIKTDVADQASFEHPPPYDSRSNGSIENAVRLFKGMLRTAKLALELRAGKRVPEQHAIVTWLIEHVAFLLTARLRGVDGKTAYQMIRGRPFSKRLVEFGERVLFKLPIKGPRQAERGELDARWSRGIVLGYSRFTNEYIVHDGTSVKRSRAVQRVVLEHRWHTEALEKVNVDIYDQHVPDSDVPFEGEKHQPAGAEAAFDKQRAPKRWPYDKQIGLSLDQPPTASSARTQRITGGAS